MTSIVHMYIANANSFQVYQYTASILSLFLLSTPSILVRSFHSRYLILTVFHRGAEPRCGDALWVGANQRPGELGSFSARSDHKLLHRVLRPAEGKAPRFHCGPNAELHPPQGPPAGHHLPGHRQCPAHLGHGEGHVCQSVYSGRWDDQYLNFTKYIYLSTVLKYRFVMQLYTSVPLHFRST